METTLKRIDGYGERWYFDTKTLRVYLSCTSFLKKVMPESDHLVEWKVKHGEKLAYTMASESAHYGNLMHKVIEEYCRTLKHCQKHGVTPGAPLLSWEEIIEITETYCRKQKLMYLRDRFVKRIRKDILSFAQFAWDKEIEVINVEQFLKWDITDEAGIAGTVDLEVNMTFNKRRVRANIDMKSGMKGFWLSSEAQLQIYKMMNPDVEMVFNWAPKDWRLGKTPSYDLKNQTKSLTAQMLPNWIENGIIAGIFTPKIREVEFDVLTYNQEPSHSIIDTETVLQNILDNEQ